jgi:hypothetical protein
MGCDHDHSQLSGSDLALKRTTAKPSSSVLVTVSASYSRPIARNTRWPHE